MTETIERTDRHERTSGGTRHDALWRVIVLNDSHNTFEGVSFALSSTLPGVGYDRGMEFAQQIHSAGRAIVWSGHKEQAEHYWQQLRDYGLTLAPLESG